MNNTIKPECTPYYQQSTAVRNTQQETRVKKNTQQYTRFTISKLTGTIANHNDSTYKQNRTDNMPNILEITEMPETEQNRHD